jgi:hypothetical protein
MNDLQAPPLCRTTLDFVLTKLFYRREQADVMAERAHRNNDPNGYARWHNASLTLTNAMNEIAPLKEP